MSIKFKRKLYSRGGSFETTIPVQMLFSNDLSKKHFVVFEYDQKSNKWIIGIEEIKNKKN